MDSQVMRLRLLCCKQGLEAVLRNGMQLSRNATPANLRLIASSFTGKTYRRSRKGLETALADVSALLKNDLTTV